MKEKICKNCKYYFLPYKRAIGVCINQNQPLTHTYPNYGCKEYADPKFHKIKPRRLCDFCERGKRMESEEGEHDLRLVKLTPLPAINLTSGETADKADPPFYAMFLYTPDRTGEAATFRVKFCPICGRKLVVE